MRADPAEELLVRADPAAELLMELDLLPMRGEAGILYQTIVDPLFVQYFEAWGHFLPVDSSAEIFHVSFHFDYHGFTLKSS